jgi:hypothetical protein
MDVDDDIYGDGNMHRNGSNDGLLSSAHDGLISTAAALLKERHPPDARRMGVTCALYLGGRTAASDDDSELAAVQLTPSWADWGHSDTLRPGNSDALLHSSISHDGASSLPMTIPAPPIIGSCSPLLPSALLQAPYLAAGDARAAIGAGTNYTLSDTTTSSSVQRQGSSGQATQQPQDGASQQLQQVVLTEDAPLGLMTRGLDPAYILPLTVSCLKHGRIEVWRLISWGCLAVSLRSLASSDPVIRWAAGKEQKQNVYFLFRTG